jgi:hypothetical protein
MKQKQKDEHSGTHFMWICTGTWLRWMIMIDPQIVFNIEKLINIICKSIRIIHLSKCTGTYPHNMCTGVFTYIFLPTNFIIRKCLFFKFIIKLMYLDKIIV